MDFDVVLGNPPYGKGGNLALKFLNSAGNRIKSDGIVLQVLPQSIRSDTLQNKIKQDLHCTFDKDCNSNDFPTGIDACIQEWEVRDYKREPVIIYKKHPDFTFLKYEDRYDADVFIGEFGDGPCGKVLTSNFTHYAKGHHFIKAAPEIVERLVKLGKEGILRKAAKEGVNGRGHCGKNKVIKTYIKYYGT